jgi:hypothetical protein
MAQLITRSHENYADYLLEYLITGFFSQYLEGVNNEPYQGFLEDTLNTLGKTIMDRQCWQGTNIVIGRILQPSNNNPNKVWCWWDASGDFSSSMFFCIKYLPYELIRDWLISALNIPSPHWRAQMIVWLVGANKILTNQIHYPYDFDVNDYPDVGWAWSHCLKPASGAILVGNASFANPDNFLPLANRLAVLEIVKQYFNQCIFNEWITSFTNYDYLINELSDLPEHFRKLYVKDN